MADKEIFWKNLKTLYSYKGKTDEGYELRIGRWVIDGYEREIILAKQEFKETVSGKILWGKIKGLNAADMYRILDAAATISQVMNFPLPKEFSKQLELLNSETKK